MLRANHHFPLRKVKPTGDYSNEQELGTRLFSPAGGNSELEVAGFFQDSPGGFKSQRGQVKQREPANLISVISGGERAAEKVRAVNDENIRAAAVFSPGQQVEQPFDLNSQPGFFPALAQGSRRGVFKCVDKPCRNAPGTQVRLHNAPHEEHFPPAQQQHTRRDFGILVVHPTARGAGRSALSELHHHAQRCGALRTEFEMFVRMAMHEIFYGGRALLRLKGER